MSTKAWGALVAGLVGALTLVGFVASSVSAKEVAPVAERVTRLEAQQVGTDRRLDEIRGDVKEILRELRDSPRPAYTKGGR